MENINAKQNLNLSHKMERVRNGSFTGIYVDLDCSKDPSLDIDDWAQGNDLVIEVNKQWSDNAVRTFLEGTL